MAVLKRHRFLVPYSLRSTFEPMFPIGFLIPSSLST
jgi:hypothetical protein